MNIEQLWQKAQERTEIIRGRVKGLSTFGNTKVPYVFLGESSVNEGHVVVRKGRIIIEKPMIVLPENMPQFEGFEFEEDIEGGLDAVHTFFYMRGIRFPSLKYNNTVDRLELEENSLSKSIEKHKSALEKKENVSTALIVGPEDCWQFSVLLHMAALIGRSAKTDIIHLLDRINGDKNDGR
ncbi:MAG: hypothetical protein GF408_00955 [Candidatus Omnitrophica bacterium]|nr:hypothetical protein [Candidatus Omnitrophota bacterium]